MKFSKFSACKQPVQHYYKYALYVQYLNKIFHKLYNINSTVVAIRFLPRDLNTQL